MQQGDIIQLVVSHEMVGYNRPLLNVYNYLVFTITDEVPLQVYYMDIVAAFRNEVISTLIPFQSASVIYKSIELKNLMFQQEIATYYFEPDYHGQLLGEYLPANVNFTFKLQRYSALTRNGRKAIPGVPEVVTTAGRLLNPAYAELVETASEALADEVTVNGDTTDATLLPVIVKRPLNPGVPPVTWTTVIAAPFSGFGTQNSRKEL